MFFRLRHLGRRKKELVGLLWTLLTLCLVVCLVIYPQASLQASQRGLKAWWDIVFPSLLPFFIGTELLIGFGVVRFMGILLEPIMRPLFNLPGAASFVLAVGFTSGFPIGSVITAQLRRENLVSRNEGEQLMSFTSNSSPLFILAAVAVGMLHKPSLGLILIAAHYGANLTLGLLIGALRRKFERNDIRHPAPLSLRLLWQRAITELRISHREKWQPLGQRFTAAISKSVNTLLMIGGFIIIFSVIIEVLGKLGVLGQLSQVIAICLDLFGIDPALSKALAAGLFEITLGTKFAAAVPAPLADKIVAITMLLSWSGISVHAQVAGLISGTDLRFLPFFLCRIAQAVLSAIYSLALYRPLTALAEKSAVFDLPNQPALAPLYTTGSKLGEWWQHLTYFSGLFVREILLLLVLACLLPMLARLVSTGFRWIWKPLNRIK